MNQPDPTETARALLYRHGLPEDVIDGALCLHAQELAAVLRVEADRPRKSDESAMGRNLRRSRFRMAADLIDPTRGEQVAASVPQQSVVVPTDWVDGHPQLEAIAAAVWEKCRHDDSGSGIDDDPRNIAVAAYTALAAVPSAQETACPWCSRATQPLLCVPCFSAERQREERDPRLAAEHQALEKICATNRRAIENGTAR